MLTLKLGDKNPEIRTLGRSLLIALGLLIFTEMSAIAEEDLRDLVTDQIARSKCEGLLATIKESHRHFVETIFPRSIKRKFSAGQLAADLVDCGENCLEFQDASSGRKLQVVWDPNIKFPSVENETTARRLRIPQTFDWTSVTAQERDGIVKSWLLGSRFHPQTTDTLNSSAVSPRRILRAIQQDGKNAVTKAMRDGERSFLYVSPTGTGKTDVLLSVIREAVTARSEKLILVLADSNVLVNQLSGNILSLQTRSRANAALDFDLVKWGDGESGSLTDILASAINRRNNSAQPLILVSTIQSLKAAAARSPDRAQLIQLLASEISTIGYDEAHHAGAPQSSALLEELYSAPNSKLFFYGTTATPMHATKSITALFKHRVFWAYLDTARSYASGSRRDPKLSVIIDQLAAAAKLGDLTPFGRFHFIDSDKLGQEFFVSSADLGAEGTRYVINPKVYPALVDSLMPIFEKHASGFVSVSTINEARELTKKLNLEAHRQSKNIKFAMLHSGLKKAEREAVDKALKSGEINFAITVRQLDEGADYPKMSLYVDLNHSVTPRQFLQRAGRVERLFPNKEEVELVSALAINELYLQETLELLQSVLKNQKFVRQVAPDSQAGTRTKSILSDETVALSQLESRLQNFWHRGLKFSPDDIAGELNRFINENHALPRSSQTWENGLYKKMIYCFYNAREDFYSALNSEAQEQVVNWLIRRLPRVGFGIRTSFLARAEALNRYFTDVEWLEQTVGDVLDLESLTNPEHVSANIRSVIRVFGLRYHDEFFELLEDRAHKYASAVLVKYIQSFPNYAGFRQPILHLIDYINRHQAMPGDETDLGKTINAIRNEDYRNMIYYSLEGNSRKIFAQWVSAKIEQPIAVDQNDLEDVARKLRWFVETKTWVIRRQGIEYCWPIIHASDLPANLVAAAKAAYLQHGTSLIDHPFIIKDLIDEIIQSEPR